eukprot:SAG25_NODE_10181_length_343_cov_1.057377_1_plen_50_part_01
MLAPFAAAAALAAAQSDGVAAGQIGAWAPEYEVVRKLLLAEPSAKLSLVK